MEIQITEIQMKKCKKNNAKIQKYNLQKLRNTNYNNTEVQVNKSYLKIQEVPRST